MNNTIKDLRKVLKGIKGDAKLSFGNCTAYSPRTFKTTLNIFYDDLTTINKENTLPNDKIKEVIFWVEE